MEGEENRYTVGYFKSFEYLWRTPSPSQEGLSRKGALGGPRCSVALQSRAVRLGHLSRTGALGRVPERHQPSTRITRSMVGAVCAAAGNALKLSSASGVCSDASNCWGARLQHP